MRSCGRSPSSRVGSSGHGPVYTTVIRATPTPLALDWLKYRRSAQSATTLHPGSEILTEATSRSTVGAYVPSGMSPIGSRARPPDGEVATWLADTPAEAVGLAEPPVAAGPVAGRCA